MKILFMAPMLDYSGAPKIMTWLANHFLDDGNDVTILTFYDEVTNENVNHSVEKVCLKTRLYENWFIRNIIVLPNIVIQTFRFIKQENYDIMISFTDAVSILNMVLVKLLTQKKFYISERADPYTITGKLDKLIKKAFIFADYIVFQTEEARSYFGNKIKGKSCVIPNPVIVNFKEKEIKERDNRIVSVGRLEIKQKRQDLLIRAFSQISECFPEIVLELYGDGPDEGILKELVSKLNLNERVSFKGVTHRVYESIYSARLFVLSSDYEGIPNALIEAMVMGVPVISTDCSPGGAKLLINNGVNGLLVERNHVKELSEAIKYMLNNSDIANKMATEAKKIKYDYAENKIFERWKSVICKDIEQ